MSSFQSTLCTKIGEIFENLVFRRVQSTEIQGTQIEYSLNFSDEHRVVMDRNEYLNTEPSVIKQHGEICSNRFSGMTSKQVIRKESDFYPSLPIYFSCHKYSYLDISGLTFTWKKDQKKSKVLPRQGDLICGIVEKDPKRKLPEYKKWFVASEQFLRMWTAIMYERHDALEKMVGDLSEEEMEKRIRDKLMSGNRLCTNSYRKKILSGIDVTEEDYWCYRNEPDFVKYTHIYACIVLMCRYGELPNSNNIPQNKDDKNKMEFWDLPEEFAENLLERFELVKKFVLEENEFPTL